MLRLFDMPVLCNRTPRELVLIGLGLAALIALAVAPRVLPIHLAVVATATGLFAARYYAARAIAIGFLLSTQVFYLIATRYGDNWLGAREGVPWFFWGLGAALVLLTSTDLGRRFDLAAGTGWRHNPWRERPRAHWYAACAGGYAIGTLGNLLLSVWARTRFDWHYWWMPLAIIGTVVALLLMFRAHKAGYALALLIGAAIAIAVLPHVGASESYLANGWTARPSSELWSVSPYAALPIAVLSALTAVISLAMLAARQPAGTHTD